MRTFRSIGVVSLVASAVLALPAPSSAQELKGSGNLIDNGWDRISYNVEDLKDDTGKIDDSKAVFVLRVEGHITWWKSLDLFKTNEYGDLLRVFRLETKDQKKEASVDVLAGDVRGMKQLEVWKAGALGVGGKVVQKRFDGTSLVGKRVTTTVHKDKPN